MKKKILIVVAILLGLIGLFYSIKTIYTKINYDNRLKEVLTDDKEIERKWLIDKDKMICKLIAMN